MYNNWFLSHLYEACGSRASIVFFPDLGPGHAPGPGLLYGLEAGETLVLIQTSNGFGVLFGCGGVLFLFPFFFFPSLGEFGST